METPARQPRRSAAVIGLCLIAFMGDPHSCAAQEGLSYTKAMVVCADSSASAAGVEVLRRGGNAVDAAVAVGFSLAVTYPEAGNIGGGGFMLIRLANGDATVIDFREEAPAAASRNMFLDAEGNPVPGLSQTGPLAAGVPGTVAGLLMALERYGSLSRIDVLDRAIILAEQGFRIDKRLASQLNRFRQEFARYRGSRKTFVRSEGMFSSGDLLVQQDLGETLREIRDKGVAGFYEGEVAELIAMEMAGEGGIITKDDLAAYTPVERTPLVGQYRNYTVVTAPPPTAGGFILIEMLKILGHFPLGNMNPEAPETLHLLAAAAQCGFADRYAFAGDPDYLPVPVDRLISDEHAAAWVRRIDMRRALSSDSLTSFPADGQEGQDGQETTHYVVIDGKGNTVSATVTLNDNFGCKTVVEGAGFFLNNEMDDFAVKTGAVNMYGLTGGEANSIAPGKRMASSMTPAIVLDAGKPVLVLGGRGGSRIPTSVAQVIVNYLDFGFDPVESVRRPRIHHQWKPETLFYEQGVPGEALQGLRKMGWEVGELVSSPGKIQAIAIINGVFTAVPDPREGGAASGF